MKHLRHIFVVFIASLVLMAFFPGSGHADQEEIKIGFVVATTGIYASAELSMVNGAKMAVEDINASGGIKGRKINLIIEDTGSQQHSAVNAFNRMAAQNPVAILDTALSTFVLAQMPEIKKAGIPTLPIGANPKITQQDNPWIFRLRTSDGYVVVAATNFFLDVLKKQKIGLLRVSDEYGEGWETGIVSTMTKRGLKPVGIEVHAPTDKDMAPHLMRLQKAGMDALIVSTHPTTHALIMKQRKQLQISVPTLHSNSAIIPATLALIDPVDSDGIYVTTDAVPTKDPDAKTKEWAERFEKKYNMVGEQHGAACYDGVGMVAEAVREKGTDPKAIADYLRTINRQGIGNYWKFDKTGEGGRQAMIVVFKGKSPEPIKRMIVD